MANQVSQRQVRVVQLEQLLKLMHQRLIEQEHSCYIRFLPVKSEQRESAIGDAASSVRDRTGNSSSSRFIDTEEEFDVFFDIKAEERASELHFIQLAFNKEFFVLDMPNSCVTKAEANRILRNRRGFFYVRDLARPSRYKVDVPKHDPLQREYIYGDEHEAAEDMAYLLYDIWRYPVSVAISFTAAAFGNGPRWETNVILPLTGV